MLIEGHAQQLHSQATVILAHDRLLGW